MPYCPICQKCLCKPVKARPDKKQETQQLRKYRGNFAKLEGQFPNDAKYGGGIISSKCGHLFHQNCLHEYITTYRTKGDCYGTTYNVLCPICGQNLCCGKMLKIDIEAHFGILEEFFQDLYKLKYMNKELKRTLELEWSDIADLEKKIESTKEEYERYKATKKAAEERCAAMEQRIAKAIEDANTCFRYREVEKQLLDENINLEAVARRMETMISARCQPEYSSASKSTTSVSSDSDSSIRNSDNRSDDAVNIISCDSIEDIHRRAVQTGSQVDISVQISVHSEWSGESLGSVNCELVSVRRSAGRRHSECTLTSHGASDCGRHNECNLVTVRKVSSTQILCHARGSGNAHSIERTGQWAIEQISQELVRAQRMHCHHHNARTDAGDQLPQNRFPQQDKSDKRCHRNAILVQQSEDQSKQEGVDHQQNALAVIPVHQTVQYNQRKAKLEAISASLPPGIIKSRSYTVRSYNNIVQPKLNVKEMFETTIEAVTSGQTTEVSPSLMKKRSYTIKVHGSSDPLHEPNVFEETQPPSQPIITEVTEEEEVPATTENDGADEVALQEPQKSDSQADLVDFLVVSCNESDEGKPPSGKPTLTDIQLEEVVSKLQDIAEGRAPQTKKHLKRRSTKVEIQSLLLPQQTKPEPAKLSVAAQPSLQVKEFAVKPGPRQRPPQVPVLKTEQRKNAPPKPAPKTNVPPVAFTVKVDPKPPLQATNNQRKSPPKEASKSIPKPSAQVPSRATAKPEKSVPTRLPLAQSRKKLPPVPHSKPNKNSRPCPSKSQEKGFNLDLSQLPPPPTPHLFGFLDISDLIVPPPPPLSIPFLNLEELPKPVPPPPPMTTFDLPQTLIGKTPESTRRNLQILLHENTSTSELQKASPKSMDCIQIVPPPPPALGLFNNDSNDELLKTIISQSSCQTESSNTTETGAAGDTGNKGAAAAAPTHVHPEEVPTVISKTSNNMAAPSKCLAAERFASSLKQQSQCHSTILDNSNCKLPSTLPQQRYVCYGYKPDGIRLSNERTTLPCYSSAGSPHHVKFNYQNMPITPIVIETNSNRMDKDSGSFSSMGSQGSNCIASNNSSSSCAEKYFFNGATNNYALASLLSQQSCQNFYRNLHKSPRFPP